MVEIGPVEFVAVSGGRQETGINNRRWGNPGNTKNSES